MRVVVGVDSHKATLAAAAVDELGRPIEAREFANEAKGHLALLEWARRQGEMLRVGIECSDTYGAGLARLLLSAGEDVREVPTRLAYRESKRRQAQGKSDPGDALAIARVVARETELPSPKRAEVMEDLKLLSDYRDQLRRARTQLTNRLHKDLVIMLPGYQKTIPDLAGKRSVAKVLKLIRGNHCLRAELMRQRVGEVQRIDKEMLRNSKLLKTKVQESGTTLTQLAGVGDVIAARILGEIGDVRKIKSKAAFGNMTGTAPVPASSGQTTRHRLNRAGNRRVNHALHLMAITQARIHPDARDYLDRKRAEGKSSKDAMRCLKRHLANAVYRQMMEDVNRLEIAA